MAFDLLAALTGFSQGVFSGAALMALAVILKLHSKLRRRLRIKARLEIYSLLGAVAGSLVSLFETGFSFGEAFAAFAGLFGGIYIGLLTASIAEAAYILPVFAKRVGFATAARSIAFAWLLGKMAGSFMNWLSVMWQ